MLDSSNTQELSVWCCVVEFGCGRCTGPAGVFKPEVEMDYIYNQIFCSSSLMCWFGAEEIAGLVCDSFKMKLTYSRRT